MWYLVLLPPPPVPSLSRGHKLLVSGGHLRLDVMDAPWVVAVYLTGPGWESGVEGVPPSGDGCTFVIYQSHHAVADVPGYLSDAFVNGKPVAGAFRGTEHNSPLWTGSTLHFLGETTAVKIIAFFPMYPTSVPTESFDADDPLFPDYDFEMVYSVSLFDQHRQLFSTRY